MKLFLKIAYLGTAYCGYQVQPNGVTVQEKLNEATRALFGVDCDIVGCSRTDSGVHARGFCATVTKKGQTSLETSIDVSRIPRALNAHLPADISVRYATFVSEDFHPRYGVESKEYEYLFFNGAERDPFSLDRMWQIFPRITGEGVEKMNLAAKCFVGKKDFSAFRDKGADTAPEDAVREVYSASVTQNGDVISFRVRANGFLYHMVRIMAGTLFSVGIGDLDPAELPSRIASLDRKSVGKTAPACGLYLDRVFYPSESGIN